MASSKPVVNLVRLGCTNYMPVLKLQQELAEKIKRSRPSEVCQRRGQENVGENYLLVLEHNPVYTVGMRDRSHYAEVAKNTNLEHKEDVFMILGASPAHGFGLIIYFSNIM